MPRDMAVFQVGSLAVVDAGQGASTHFQFFGTTGSTLAEFSNYKSLRNLGQNY